MHVPKIPPKFSIMPAVALALAVFGSLFELIQVNGGLGWDGVYYVSPPQLSPYYLTRIVPMGLAKALTFSPVTSWRILNGLCSLISAILWAEIAENLDLKGGKWTGFCGLFLTFQAKQFYFDPVLVDAAAELAAMVLLYLHLRRAHLLLSLATIIASFCWPTAALTGAALLAFVGIRHEHRVRGLGPLVVITALSVAVYAVCWAIRSPVRSFVTAIPSYALLGVAMRPLIDRYRWRFPHLAVVAIVPVLVGLMAAQGTAGPSTSQYLRYLILPQSGMFFLPALSLTVYYGPVLVLGALHWGKVATAAKSLGVTLPILINLPFALTTEPRHFLFGWPFLVTAIAVAVDKFWCRIAVLAALWSQFWLPINIATWRAGEADAALFPKQLWFMHFGFWMSFATFALNALLVAATAYLLWLKKRSLTSQPAGLGH